MKYLFVVFLFLHGIIHLFGFSKAFGISQMDQIKSRISKVQGIFWFMAFVLFSYSGEALLSKNSYWYRIALLAVVLSVILIIRTWKDTKYGILPNIIICIAATISVYENNFNEKISKEISEITNNNYPIEHIIRQEQLKTLPFPVANWLKKSGMVGKRMISTVHLQQRAKMKLNKEQKKWYNAVAEQHIATFKPAFVWKVELTIDSFIKINGRDKLKEGKGEMLIKLFSVFKLAEEYGQKVNESIMQRYLAEIVWFPSAALNSYIEWEPIDSLSAKAVITYHGISTSGIFYFNKDGDFVRFRCFRYKENKIDSKKYEWIIDVLEYSEESGIKVPVKTKVSWILESGLWTWLVLEITDIKYNYNKQIANL
jgi:hypothetical protein